MTERDKKIIELVNQCGVITREQVQRVLFKDTHINVPLRRLKVLVDNKQIKRSYFNLGGHVNSYVYYQGKKPSKRLISHNLLITEFITKVMSICEVIEIETNYKIGNIIADAYIRYKTYEGRTRHLFLEIQLSNKVSDCVEKYKGIKEIILDEKPLWTTIPRVIVVTDLPHNNEQLKGITVKYDTKQMNNIRDLLF